MATNVPSSCGPTGLPDDVAARPARESEASLTGLVTGIVNDAQELIKQQVALLKHDIRSDIRQAKEGFTSLAIGGGIAALGAVLLSFMLVHLFYWLVPAVPLWGWFAIVGGLITVIGVILIYAGVRRISELNPLPENTVEAMRENLRWTTKPSASASR